jgi:predicted RND superfamily exporter protein
MNAFARGVRRYVDTAFARPWLVLAVLAAFTALCVWRGTLIRVETDLKRLLPEDADSVVALEAARERRGESDQFVIAVTSPDPLATVQLVDALAERMQQWPEVEWVAVQEDRSFFREHALLYLPVDDLRRIHDNLKRIIRMRLGQANPLYVDLEEEDREAENWEWRNADIWIDPLTLTELGLEQNAVASLFPFMAGIGDGSGEGSGVAVAAVAETEDERIARERRELPEEYRDYYIAPSGRVAVVKARLNGRSTDITFSREMFERGAALIAELDPASFHPEMRAQVVGAYKSFDTVRQLSSDGTTATLISLVLVVLLLVGFFRNFRSLTIVLVPLLCGIAWTLGLVDVVYGELNSLTIFVFSILIGMGIDFGIHIYSRALEEYHGGASWPDAVFTSSTRTGRALVSATVTTVVALLALTLAHFDGFVEFGVACGLGVAICLLATLVVCPPLIAAMERLRATPRKPRAAGDSASAVVRLPLTLVRVAGAVVLALSLVGVAVAGKAGFEYDFRNLEAPRDPNRIAYGAALGQGRSSSPAVILGESEAQMRQVHAELSRRLREGDPLIRGFSTVESLVPSGQEERMAVITDIADTLDRRAVRNIDGDEGEVIAELTRLAEVEPFGAEAVPAWAIESLTERDGQFGRIGLLYGAYDSDDALDVMRFQDGLGRIATEEGEVRVSSNGFIIADVVRYVQADGKSLIVYVTIALFLTLLIDFRRLGPTLVCMLTLASSVALTVLGMVVFDIKLGLYNMVVLPTALGTGIDASIHLYHRFEEEAAGRLGNVLATTGVSVAASSLTTVAGFVGLMLVDHKGVQTIGQLAVIGIAASMISAVTILPAILTFTARGRAS